jgi:chaperonin GroES
MFMAKKIIPLGDRLLLQAEKKEEGEQKTQSGFIVSTKAEEQTHPKVAIVKEIGPEVKNIQVGETVVFKEFIPTNFDLEEEKYLLISEEDILAKIA